MIHTVFDQAKNIAMMLLRQYQLPTHENIRDAVNAACAGLRAMGITSDGEVDRGQLQRDIEAMLSIWAPDGTQLVDATGHEVWLPDRRSKINWDFWRRYELYLEQEKRIPPPIISRLDGLTDRVLGLLEDPNRRGAWDRRGMVVGQVQSGKTANYTGLICKAVDAGYKLIIVLAGIHNSLRSQTQLRLDEGFLGRDTQQSRVFTQESAKLGVGHFFVTERRLAAHSLTTSAGDGDFHRIKAKSVAMYIGSDPVILVIKKNGSVLRNLINWVQLGANVAQKDASGKFKVRNLPVLVLDDEADHASVNTKQLELDETGRFKDEQDPTAINRLIRQLLDTFEQSAYVGYTATPFANIFIPPDYTTAQYGDDLFPRSFIINLPAPSNYIGPVQVFGMAGVGDEAAPGLPVVRVVSDSEALIPSSHKSHLVPPALPESLQEAMKAFILSCAARLARRQTTSHNSMLIHVTRFNAVQRIVGDLVQHELRSLKQRLEYGDGDRIPSLRNELRDLWERDFIPTTMEIICRELDPDLHPLQWSDVEPYLKDAALKVGVKLINGEAQDVLDYFDHPNGLSVIAIGGDKLSRGLTLEGLTISYYLRGTRMYDTLMQMGRWFGYRPGYLDLCRLYTTSELVEWYEHITAASEELRAEFDRMATAHLTPLDFGLKVQTHPGGLMVTSAGKMRYGRKMRVSFDNSLVESHMLQKDASAIDHNFNVTDTFVSSLSAPTRTKGADYRWDGVAGSQVAAYLSALHGHPSLPVAEPPKLAEYISKKLLHGELTEWTVVLINVASKAESRPGRVGGHRLGLSERTPPPHDSIATEDLDTYHIRNRHIITQDHEWIDLTDDELKQALDTTHEEWRTKGEDKRRNAPPDKPSGAHVRAARSKSRGLLLIYPLDPEAKGLFLEDDERRRGKPIIGYALSFPGTSRPDEAVEYLVNTVYWKEEFGDE